MAPKKEINIEKRIKVTVLKEEGFSYSEIGEKLNLSKNGVHYILKRHKETGDFLNREGRGGEKRTSERDEKYIALLSKKNRKLTAPDITAEVNKRRNDPISVTTVKRILQKNGLHGRVAARKPLLRPANRKKRLLWAKEHVNWTEEEWSKVLFSDESKFQIFGGNRRVYVRRQVGERMNKDLIVPTVKHGGGSVMVWGCFGNEQVGNLKRINGIMDAKMYHGILVKHAVPSGKRLIGNKFEFQEDNDPKTHK